MPSVPYKKKGLILFDYNCTPQLDGPVLDAKGQFDLNHLEQYDRCK